MILCVNANAAIDKTAVVENFQLNAIHRPSYELALPGGKGCNVARAVKLLGDQSVVAGWVGGHAGRFIEEGLHAEGIETAFAYTTVESRTCLSVIDPTGGTITEIYEKGRMVTPEELEAFYPLLETWLPRVALVTLSGSLPPGVPTDFYAQVIRRAAEASVPAILDSSGEALRRGIDGRPACLKCNRAELADLLGLPLEQPEDALRAARQLANEREMTVVVTLGAEGAVAAEPGRAWRVNTPSIQAVSAVGSGDAFLAGLACATVAGQPLEAALTLASAAGAANALQIGAGRLRAEDAARLREQVRVAAV
jgi:tagatose 6-phosphate kinase